MSRHFFPGTIKGSKFKYVDQEALLSIAYEEWKLAQERTRHMLLQFFKGGCGAVQAVQAAHWLFGV